MKTIEAFDWYERVRNLENKISLSALCADVILGHFTSLFRRQRHTNMSK